MNSRPWSSCIVARINVVDWITDNIFFILKMSEEIFKWLSLWLWRGLGHLNWSQDSQNIFSTEMTHRKIMMCHMCLLRYRNFTRRKEEEVIHSSVTEQNHVLWKHENSKFLLHNFVLGYYAPSATFVVLFLSVKMWKCFVNHEIVSSFPIDKMLNMREFEM